MDAGISQFVKELGQCWRTNVTLAQNDPRKEFLGTRYLLLSQFLYFLCTTSFSILSRTCVYRHIYDFIDNAYELPLLPNRTASESFTQIGSGAKCWLDIYHSSSGLDVTGPLCDIGQYVLQSSFQTGSNSNSNYFHIFLPFHIPRVGLLLEIKYNNLLRINKL